MIANAYNGATLAYLGDAAIEVLVRERLLRTGISDVGKLNRMAADYVRATVQSAAVERILSVLTEEETDLYKRGRNTHGLAIPRSASAGEYRRATGMESLFGGLYLAGKSDRMRELFDLAYPMEEASETQGE